LLSYCFTKKRHRCLVEAPTVSEGGDEKILSVQRSNDQIKNIQQIEHTRHRSVVNAMINVLAALVAYTYQPRKPSLNLSQNELKLLTFQE